jgi:hypothetical protein
MLDSLSSAEAAVSGPDMASTPDVTSECAVLAFHKTFSRPGGHRRGRRRANTKNLPAELLMMIFKLVYDQETKTSKFLDSPKWIEKDIMSSSLFPYAIASVCSLWKDVMSLVPDFWTRVVVLVDSPSILPSVVISWSRDLPIDLIITRKDSEHSVDTQQERTQAVSIMKTLVDPHVFVSSLISLLDRQMFHWPSSMYDLFPPSGPPCPVRIGHFVRDLERLSCNFSI